MEKGVSLLKLQKEHSGDEFFPKIKSFLLKTRILFKILYLKDCT